VFGSTETGADAHCEPDPFESGVTVQVRERVIVGGVVVSISISAGKLGRKDNESVQKAYLLQVREENALVFARRGPYPPSSGVTTAMPEVVSTLRSWVSAGGGLRVLEKVRDSARRFEFGASESSVDDRD
jgi:hypothetical protein